MTTNLKSDDPTYIYKYGCILNNADIAIDRIKDTLDIHRKYNLLDEEQYVMLLRIQCVLEQLDKDISRRLDYIGVIDT